VARHACVAHLAGRLNVEGLITTNNAARC
jgi:hypothetical protein